MNAADTLHFQHGQTKVISLDAFRDEEIKTTRIPNEMLDAILAHRFTHRQQTVLFLIIRKTIGFNKDADQLALSQITKKTGIHRPHASVALKDLERMNVIKVEQGQHANLITLNHDHKSWLPVSAVTETVTGDQNGNKVLPKQAQQKTTPNSNRKEKESAHDGHVVLFRKLLPQLKAQAFDVFWTGYPNKDKKQEAMQRFCALPYDPELYAYINARVALFKTHKRTWLEGYVPGAPTFLYRKRWTDELDLDLASSFTPEQQVLVDLYNRICADVFGKLTEWTASRATRLNRMLDRHPLEKWEKYFTFVRYENDFSNLTCPINFDFLTKPENFSNIVAGDYRSKGGDYAR